MNSTEFALKENIAVWKIARIRELLNVNTPISEIQKRIKMKSGQFNRVVSYIIFQHRDNTRIEKQYNYDKRYWRYEHEMLIQDYKVEDLKGDELLILNELK